MNEEESGRGVESESRDEVLDVEDMPGLGLLNLDIALRHSTSSVYLQRECGQLPAIVLVAEKLK